MTETFPAPTGSPGHHEGKLASLILVSNRHRNIEALFDSIADTVSISSRVEVVVKIDDGDEAIRQQMELEACRRPFTVRHISTPPPASHFTLWRSLNDLFHVIDPSAYFICNINDEVRFLRKGWDDVLARYVGFFPDDIFRLRVSRFKLHNYFDIWECFYGPENYAFHTKKWIDIQGDWNACHASDAFQQCVAFYLALGSYPGAFQINRDIPIWGIELGGQEAAEGLTGEKLEARNRGNDRAWYRLMGYEMQTEVCRRARLLQGHIWAYERSIDDFSIRDDPARKRLIFYNAVRECFIVFSYHVNRRKIEWNLFRERLRGDLFHYRRSVNFINERRNFLGNPESSFPNRVFHSSRPIKNVRERARWLRSVFTRALKNLHSLWDRLRWGLYIHR